MLCPRAPIALLITGSLIHDHGQQTSVHDLVYLTTSLRCDFFSVPARPGMTCLCNSQIYFPVLGVYHRESSGWGLGAFFFLHEKKESDNLRVYIVSNLGAIFRLS